LGSDGTADICSQIKLRITDGKTTRRKGETI
jgi:hypothetical protein